MVKISYAVATFANRFLFGHHINVDDVLMISEKKKRKFANIVVCSVLFHFC